MDKSPTTTNATIALLDGGNASEAVVDAVADEEGVSPVDVRPPLYTVIDPDALDELAVSMARRSTESPGRIVFPYAGYEVTVREGGEVTLADQESESELSL